MNQLHYLSILFLMIFTFSNCNSPCDNIECLNNGICDEGICDCPEGFEGENCEIDKNSVNRLLKTKDHFTLTSQTRWVYTYYIDGNVKSKRQYGVLNDIEYYKSVTTYYEIKDTIFEDLSVLESEEVMTRYKLYKSDDQIIRDLHYRFTPDEEFRLGNSYVIELDENCGISKEFSANKIISNEYTDGNCSFTSETIFADGTLHRLERTKRDEYKIPEKDMYNYLIEDRGGNITEFYKAALYLDSTGIVADVIGSFDVVHSYNEYGYPITESRTYLNGSTEMYEYTYY